MEVGGADVGALVLDTGSSFTKVGHAGDSEPKVCVPTTVGSVPVVPDNSMDIDLTVDKDSGARRYFFDTKLRHFHENIEAMQPVKDGIIQDWDAVVNLWEYTIKDVLREDKTERPLLFSEPPWNPPKKREEMCEIIFERVGTKAAYVMPDAVLASFCLGKTTALIIDSGGDSTRCVPVHDGFCLKRTIRKTKCAGNFLQDLLQKHLEGTHGPDIIRPRFEGKATAPKNPAVTNSYRAYMKSEVVRGMKEALFKVPQETSDTPRSLKPVSYELPDGKMLNIGEPREGIPDVLFQRFHKDLQDDFDSNKHHFEGLHLMVQATINNCDADIRRDLYNSIILAGGNSMIKGLETRLAKEICKIAPPAFVPKIVQAPGASFNRQFCPWIGGSILGSLGFFQQMWMTKSEYDEHGRKLITKGK